MKRPGGQNKVSLRQLCNNGMYRYCGAFFGIAAKLSADAILKSGFRTRLMKVLRAVRTVGRKKTKMAQNQAG